jgi:hypothetical protein
MPPDPAPDDNYDPDHADPDDDLDAADQVVEEIEDVLGVEDRVGEHPLVVAVAAGNEGVELLRVVQHEIARASAELGFLDLRRAEFEGDELLERGRAITRQVRAMKRLAELELLRLRRFGMQPTDLHGDPQVHRVLDLLVQRICDLSEEVLPQAKASELNTKLRRVLEADPAVPWP